MNIKSAAVLTFVFFFVNVSTRCQKFGRRAAARSRFRLKLNFVREQMLAATQDKRRCPLCVQFQEFNIRPVINRQLMNIPVLNLCTI